MDKLNKNNQDLIEEIKLKGITDNIILNAFEQVPREIFVDDQLVKEAYINMPLSIGFEQTISQPYVIAYMISYLHLKKTDKVLEIGTGTGYQTAILAHLCKEVHSVERIKALLDKAKVNILKLNLKNITFILKNALNYSLENNFFDAIIISASYETIPKILLLNLRNGGSLIMPKKFRPDNQKLILVKKIDGKNYIQKELEEVRFVPLINKNCE